MGVEVWERELPVSVVSRKVLWSSIVTKAEPVEKNNFKKKKKKEIEKETMFLFVEAILVAKAAGASFYLVTERKSLCFLHSRYLYLYCLLSPSLPSLPLLPPSLLLHAQFSECREDIKCSAPHRGAAQPSAAAAVSAALPGDY